MDRLRCRRLGVSRAQYQASGPGSRAVCRQRVVDRAEAGNVRLLRYPIAAYAVSLPGALAKFLGALAVSVHGRRVRGSNATALPA